VASPTPSVTATPSSAAPQPALGPDCTDAEIQVRTEVGPTSATTTKLVYGGTFVLRLQISNISNRSCTRDVGSIAEELLIKQGSKKIWSSDDCVSDSQMPHDVRTFHPGALIAAVVRWSSYEDDPTSCKNSSTPAPVGTYQLIGRVGTKLSAPTSFTIQH
jgi:hypothetical protein